VDLEPTVVGMYPTLKIFSVKMKIPYRFPMVFFVCSEHYTFFKDVCLHDILTFEIIVT